MLSVYHYLNIYNVFNVFFMRFMLFFYVYNFVLFMTVNMFMFAQLNL